MPFIVNIILVILLVSYLSLYPMLFASILTYVWPRSNIWRLVFGSPVIWSVTELFRSIIFTGFPWLQFGYSQIDGPLKGIAPIFGFKTITFILMIISGLFTLSLVQRRPLSAFFAISILFIFWPLCLCQWYQYQDHRAINISIVQGNILPSKNSTIDKINLIIDSYLNYTLPIIGKTKIIIWPECAIPDHEFDQKEFLTTLDKQLILHNTSLITGIIDARLTPNGYNYYNSLIVLGIDKQNPYQYPSKHRYDKHHLVLFGETLPFKNILKQLAILSNFPFVSLSNGKYLQPQLTVAGIKLTATICYEIIFGEQVRDNFSHDSDFILNIANDAWFGDSIGPWQHFQMARMRALELGRPLLRSTNNGITAVINADGTQIIKLPQFVSDVLNIRITPTKGMTPYAYTGYLPLCIINLIFGSLALILRNKYK